VALVAVAGCATFGRPVEQRTTHGPTAEQMWKFRLMTQNGRTPSFEERQYWEDRLEQQISTYLRAHPEVANSLEVSSFRHAKQVVVGMSREQIEILLGRPDAVVSDPGEIEKASRKFWPMIKGRASEVWTYPLGWSLYFSGRELVDMTQYLPKS
jgi:hypothetical protein